MPETIPFANHEFYKFANDSDLKKILDLGNKISMKAGEYLIQEGGKAEFLYIIISGSAEVAKDILRDDSVDMDYIEIDSSKINFKTFDAGRIVGESSFFDDKIRTQSVVLLEDSEVIKISYKSIEELKDSNNDLYYKIMKILGSHVTFRLRKSNTMLVGTMLEALISSHKKLYFIKILLSISVVAAFILLFIDYFRIAYVKLSGLGDTLLTAFVMLLIFASLKINKKQPRKEFFGLTMKNFGSNFLQGIYYTAFMLTIITIGKYFVFPNQDLFSGYIASGVSPNIYLPEAFLYIIFTFLQELIVRGIIQSSFHEILGHDNKGSILLAIFLSNMLFASFHIILFPTISVFSLLIIGIPWGWMYYKSKSLVGPVTSHGLVGFYIMWILGLL